MELGLKIVFLILASADVGFIVNYFLRRRREYLETSYVTIMSELDNHYFCGHSIFNMIHIRFFQRFGQFNQEGFCYTVSAVIALSLKKFHRTRIVRGRIKKDDFDSYHSWVEVYLIDRWWVIDPCFLDLGFVSRFYYYRIEKPKILVTYHYRQIWRDPAAEQYYERLCHPETSKIFCNLYWHYTPKGDGIKIENLCQADTHLPEKGEYYLFPPDYGFKFNQRIVNDFMARPTRMSPRRRSLRRLEKFYKYCESTSQNQTPA